MTTVHGGYDQISSKCKTGPQPGTIVLQNCLEKHYETTSDGIFNCRNVRGGSTPSAHGEGRAVDLHWTVEATGRVIAQFMVDNADALGIQCVIWWDQIWSAEIPHWHTYTPGPGGDRHHGHLHIEQNWSGAENLTTEACNKVLGGEEVELTDAEHALLVATDSNMKLVIDVLSKHYIEQILQILQAEVANPATGGGEGKVDPASLKAALQTIFK